jgi:hypothetical protein
VLRLIQVRLATPSLAKKTPICETNSPRARIPDSNSKKRHQRFLRVHNKTLSIAAMCVCNPDRSPIGAMFSVRGSSALLRVCLRWRLD